MSCGFVLSLIALLNAATSYTILNVNNPLSSENVDVRVIRRSKRDVASQAMSRFYDVRLRVTNGRDVTMRLKRHEETAAVIGVEADWAGYTSEDVRGIFIVRRKNLTNVILEGYMDWNGSRYYIQANNANDGHTLHKISHHAANHTYSENNRLSPVSHEGRYKRHPDMWRLPMLYFKCSFMFDYDAVELATRRFLEVGVSDAIPIIKQIAVLSALYVQDTFMSLRGTVRLTFQTASVEHRTSTSFSIDTLSKPMTVNSNRRSICAEQMHRSISRTNHRRRKKEHSVYFTGIGVGNDGGPDERSIDCPASDNYIMSPNIVAPYSEPNADLYSICSKRWLVHSITVLQPPPNSNCFNAAPSLYNKLQHEYLGRRLSHDDQCFLATYSKAVPDQDLTYICAHGIKCENGARIIAMSGTRCRGPYPYKYYWCHRRICVDRASSPTVAPRINVHGGEGSGA